MEGSTGRIHGSRRGYDQWNGCSNCGLIPVDCTVQYRNRVPGVELDFHTMGHEDCTEQHEDCTAQHDDYTVQHVDCIALDFVDVTVPGTDLLDCTMYWINVD